MPNICTPEWVDRLTDVAQFLLDHDRLPTKDGGREEASMTQWRTHQRTDYNTDRLVPKQRDLLDATGIPQTGWMDGDRERRHDATWFTNLNAVVAHLNTTGRRPSTVAEDPEEYRLGHWLSVQLCTRDDLSEHRRTALVDAGLTSLPNSTRLMHADTWHRRFAELDAFVTEHRRRPTHNSDDPVEKSIGQWLAKQRVAMAKNTLADDRLDRLSEVQERTGVDLLSLLKRDVVGAIIGRVAAFHFTHGRLPNVNDPDGLWLHNVRHRHRHGTLAPATAKALDKIDPHWLRPVRIDSFRAIQEIADFVAKHDRFPAKSNADEQETRLVDRLNVYRHQARHGDLRQTTLLLLNEKVPGWDVLPSERKFADRLTEIADRGPDARPGRNTPLSRWRYQLIAALREGRVPAKRVDLIRERAPWLLTAAGLAEENTSRASA